MGSKGKDLALWIFFACAAPAVVLPRPWNWVFLVPVLACGGWYWLHYLIYVPLARRASRGLGLKHVVLLPVPVRWARFLIRISGGRIDAAGVQRAFEVHVEVPRGLGLADFCCLLGRDLALANRLFPGSLFVWETAAPLPASFRALVRREAARGRAFWAKGGWRVPPFPPRRKPKGVLRRGAVVAPGVVFRKLGGMRNCEL